MSCCWRGEEKVSIWLQYFLNRRHATMIWAFILFSLITTAPPNVSEQSGDESEGEEKFSCSRLDLVGLLRKSGSSILPLIDEDLPVFGPQLPAAYEQYRRHVERNDSNGTVSDAGRVSLVDDSTSGKDRLEADLDRLLAQENKMNRSEGTTGSPRDNQTAAVEQPPQEADPPLPSFNEWTKQKLEEQLQTKQQLVDAQLKNVAANGSPSTPVAIAGSGPSPSSDGSVKTIEHIQHARNYASKECGAKVLLANSQAQHASSVLNEKEPDEYMLNPCNAEQKFFVVELCETVQITRLDLANFELFSSSPKEFRVFVSERYPATEWTFLGAWTAEDQRKIQNFPVERRLYAKYVKVELLSHYGSEHFCPVSLIRVLGISVVEEYEAEAAKEQLPPKQVAEPEAVPIVTPNEPGEKAEDSTPSPFESPVTPAENGSSVVQPAATPDPTPAPIEPEAKTKFIRQELLNSAKDAVVQMAKGVIDKAQAVFGGTKSEENATVVVNITEMDVIEEDVPVPPTALPVIAPILRNEQWRQCLICDTSNNVTRQLCGYVRAFLVKRQPLVKVVQNETIKAIVNGSESSSDNKKQIEAATPVEEALEVAAKDEKNSTTTDAGQNTNGVSQKATPSTPIPPLGVKPPLSPPPPTTAYPSTGTVDSSSLPGVATTAKETVFARLNSRIRALENNISLSGEYLGELSTRYRKQMDDMQKSLNRSNAALAQHTKTTEEKLSQYRIEIELLQNELDKVKAQMLEYNLERALAKLDTGNETKTILDIERTLSAAETWAPAIVLAEIILFVIMLLYCCRGRVGADERMLEAMVERRVRQVMVEELRKLKSNGVSVMSHPFGSHVGNGHVPLNRSPEGLSSLDIDGHAGISINVPAPLLDEPSDQISPAQKSPNQGGSGAVISKARKKKRRNVQQQKILVARKCSDQTSGLSSRRETRDDISNENDSSVALNDSSAGILFSTSNQSATAWRRVLPSWRRTTLSNQNGQKPKRRGSDDRLDAAKLNPTSKWKFLSQNAFEVLASSSSSESHSRASPEKRPRVGRGPS